MTSRILLFLASITLLFNACKKEGNVGGNIIPASDLGQVYFLDTTVTAVKIERDLPIIGSNESKLLLGTSTDPNFGKAFSGIYGHFTTQSNSLNLGTGLSCDSIILFLDLAGVFGAKDKPVSLTVHEVLEFMSPDEDHNTTKDFLTDLTELGRVDGFIAPETDSIVYGGETFPAHIRIKLSNAFGQKLLNYSGQPEAENNEAWIEQALKGLYIKPDTSVSHINTMLYVDWFATYTKLTVFYDSDSTQNLSYDFVVDRDNNVSLLNIHNYNNSKIQNALQTGGVDTFIYLEGLSGLRARVTLPDLSFLGDVAINKAQLVATAINEEADSLFQYPLAIQNQVINDSGDYVFVNDAVIDQLTNQYISGGLRLLESDSLADYTRYRFNLAITQQQIKNGVVDQDYVLMRVFPSASAPERIVIGGPNHPDENIKLKLQIVYSKF